MNSLKRSYIQQKGSASRYNEDKDMPTSSRHGIVKSSSEKDAEFNIPMIKLSENSRFLPRYSLILSRTSDDGVNMVDLNQLQKDFEKLLSTCSVRNRFLRAEIECIDKVEEKRGDRKGKPHEKTSVKRKRTDERFKYNDPRNGSKPIKRHYSNLIRSTPIKREVPKVNLVKNDTSDKFWATIEPYCAPINNYHAAFLDKLIEECSQEVDFKIPELGEYYANEWTNSALNSEQELGITSKSACGGEMKKNGINEMIDNTFPSAKTQRILALLIEEKVMTTFPNVTGKLKSSDLNIMKPAGGPRAAICMDRQLEKNLVEQGILSVDDLRKNVSEDEILSEIKKCQQELSVINKYNVEELNRLKTVVTKELQKQDVLAALSKVDSQILDLYNEVILTKQKDDDGDFDKVTLTKFEIQTDALLNQQQTLQKQLTELSHVQK